MAHNRPNPFTLSLKQIQRLLQTSTTCLPELEVARSDISAFGNQPHVQAILDRSQCHLQDFSNIPQTRYSAARLFALTGNRTSYEIPYFTKRAALSSAAFRLFLGQAEFKSGVQDYAWDICEETSWVVPAHEPRHIDLFSAETGFLLAETVYLLGRSMDEDIQARIAGEIERRLFIPYLDSSRRDAWYQHHSNWNGVCNSSVACAALLLEPDPARLAQVIHTALAGLHVFMNSAFENDGTSTEGVSYWQYGLMHFVALSEMLRARTEGGMDLLASARASVLAGYPAKMLINGSSFANFSDCEETVHLHPGIMTRLAERTQEHSLLTLTCRLPETLDWRLPIMIRNSLWWDGRDQDAQPPADTWLPQGGIAKLVKHSPPAPSVVLALKAGHNAENHNHNDVGSFILSIDGETFLCDPGRGRYSRQYFGPERYDNILVNSYGHSVPRVGGHLQHEGCEYRGTIRSVNLDFPIKSVEMDISGAYPVSGLTQLYRRLSLDWSGVTFLCDTIHFSAFPTPVEEALVTWLPVVIIPGGALLHGTRHTLKLTIESPGGLSFRLDRLDEQSKSNDKPGILSRLSFVLPLATDLQAQIRMETIQDRNSV